MIKRLAFALLLLVPGALYAQEGTIAYRHSIKLDLELPPEFRARLEARGGGAGMVPTERVSDFVLLFNASESLMKPVPTAPGEARPPQATDRRRSGMMARLSMSSTSRRDRESIVEAYVRYDEGTIVEQICALRSCAEMARSRASCLADSSWCMGGVFGP